MTAPSVASSATTFHEERRTGVGGSDAAAILGLDPYRTVLDVYREKCGLVALSPDTPDTLRGKHLEAVARELYATKTERRVTRVPFRRSRHEPWRIGHIDGRITRGVGQEPPTGAHRDHGVLEIKCPRVAGFARAQREGLPMRFVIQLQHYLDLFGASWGSFALFSAEQWQMIHFDMPADQELQARIREAERSFWQEHVEPRIPPAALDANASVVAAIEQNPDLKPKGTVTKHEDADWAEAAQTYREAKDLAETAEQLEATAKDRLKALMGVVGIAEGAGIRCYWSERPGRRSLDRKALEGAGLLDPIAVGVRVKAWVEEGEPGGVAEILGRLEAARADVGRYDKVGKPFTEFRAYPVTVGTGD